jgi:putative flavoprotein involved in K+ transport
MLGKNPDGLLTRNEIISYFENYIRQNHLPIWYGAQVFIVEAAQDGYTLETTACRFEARNVVVATGLYQKPRLPRFRGALS